MDYFLLTAACLFRKDTFNNSESRDANGRWTSGGGSGHLGAKAKAKSKAGNTESNSESPGRISINKSTEGLSAGALEARKTYVDTMLGGKEYTQSLERALKNASTEETRLAAFSDFHKKLLADGISEKKAKDIVSKIEFDEDMTPARKKKVEDAATEFFQMSKGRGKENLAEFYNFSEFGAYADKEKKRVNVTDKAPKDEVFHEMGHHLEFDGDGKTHQAALEFRRMREKNYPDKKKTQILKKSKHIDKGVDLEPLKSEFTFGKYVDPYVGRKYDDGWTEVTSVGMQHFSSPKAMKKLYEKDKSHFHFIAGVLNRHD